MTDRRTFLRLCPKAETSRKKSVTKSVKLRRISSTIDTTLARNALTTTLELKQHAVRSARRCARVDRASRMARARPARQRSAERIFRSFPLRQLFKSRKHPLTAVFGVVVSPVTRALTTTTPLSPSLLLYPSLPFLNHAKRDCAHPRRTMWQPNWCQILGGALTFPLFPTEPPYGNRSFLPQGLFFPSHRAYFSRPRPGVL